MSCYGLQKSFKEAFDIILEDNPTHWFLSNRNTCYKCRWSFCRWIFAGGDVVTGPNTVIDAMASGKIAAEIVDKYVMGKA